MKKSRISPKPSSTATFQVALWVLGAVLLAQFAAVAWAVIGPGKKDRFAVGRDPAERRIDDHSEIGEPHYPGVLPAFPDDPGHLSGLNPPLPPLEPALPPSGSGTHNPPNAIPPELGGTAPQDLPPSPLALGTSKTTSVSDEPYYIVPASARLRSPEVLGVLAAAINLRGEGDTQGALESLRRADSMRPNNPRILFEMATTYHHMGLREKAETYWQRVLDMGEQGAGDYFALADMELIAGKPATEAPQGDPVTASRGMIYIGDITAVRDPSVTDGERVQIRVPIGSSPGEVVQNEKVAAYIYFYDLVGGRMIEQTTPRTDILQNWSSIPIDWTSSDPEILDVTYYQRTPLTEPGAPSPQARRYYGYVIRLFYDNILQDIVTSPRTLIDFNPADKDSNPQLDNALFGG